MLPESLFQHLTPYARAVTAVAPFLGALVSRLLFGKNQVTRVLLSVSVMWFAANVFMAPYSYGTQRDMMKLGRALFR